jgi:hypothetical protein
VPTFADRGFRVVRVTDTYARILGFLDLNNFICTKLNVTLQNFYTSYFNAEGSCVGDGIKADDVKQGDCVLPLNWVQHGHMGRTNSCVA